MDQEGHHSAGGECANMYVVQRFMHVHMHMCAHRSLAWTGCRLGCKREECLCSELELVNMCAQVCWYTWANIWETELGI